MSDQFLFSDEMYKFIGDLPKETIEWPLGITVHSSPLFPFINSIGETIHGIMLPSLPSFSSIPPIMDWGYSEKPEARQVSPYFQHLGFQIMIGPARHRRGEKLYRFNKRKGKWLPIVGYKLMRRVCRKKKSTTSI